MNIDQFRAVLDLGRDGHGRTVLPVAHEHAERLRALERLLGIGHHR